MIGLAYLWRTSSHSLNSTFSVQVDGARRGHVGRTDRAGAPQPAALRGRAISRGTGRTEAHLSEESGAGKPHAGICVGGRQATGVPTATTVQNLMITDERSQAY
jgi:hypothetical protein